MAEQGKAQRKKLAGVNIYDFGPEPREQIQSPLAPGAKVSPQQPGQVPDRSTIPGHHSTRVPEATSVRRPLTQFGTAQEIMQVFRAKTGNREEIVATDFEQATASYEELRKAYPVQLPPERPAPGYILDKGDAAASELQAIGGPVPDVAQTHATAFEGHAPQPAPASPSSDAAKPLPPKQ